MAVVSDQLDDLALELLDVLTELQLRRGDVHSVLSNVRV